jgi:AcrR family transcriptional regulator
MSSDPRRKRADAVNSAKREMILAGARAVFEADGLEGASMRAIAEAAGYTAAALYFHFPSKEAVYGAVLEQSLDGLILAVTGAVSSAENAPRRLRAAGLAFFDFYAGNPRDLDLGFYLFRGGMRPRGLSQELDQRLNAKLISALAPIGTAARDLGAGPARARVVTAEIFAHAAGLLLLDHTGRLKLFAAKARVLMDAHVTRVIRELEETPR